MPKRRVTRPKAKAKSTGTLALTGDFGLPQAAVLKSQLAALQVRPAPLTLDLTAVTRLDTASLQLLAAFVRERQTQGQAVLWHGVPRWFEDAAQRLGLTAALAVARA